MLGALCTGAVAQPNMDYALLAIGPKAQTYQHGKPEDPAQWSEIISPDLDCTVRNLTISGVRTCDSQSDLPIECVVQVIEQKRNPDYPKTMPKGGTGKGSWVRWNTAVSGQQP